MAVGQHRGTTNTTHLPTSWGKVASAVIMLAAYVFLWVMAVLLVEYVADWFKHQGQLEQRVIELEKRFGGY